MAEKTLPQVRKARLPYIDRSREMAWIAEHWREYPDQWVALDGDRLIAHGDDPIPFKEIARAQGAERPLIAHLQKDDGSIYGRLIVKQLH
ncbi:MAG: DUF5678 domain-containing protein [Acidobacteriota bacterium]